MARERDAGPPTYDDRGDLLAGEKILGVEVPRAMRVRGPVTTERATLEGDVPIEKAIRFYQRRLTTGQVESSANGARFVDATPRSPGDGTRKLNVLVLADERAGVRISIVDRTPRPGPSPTDEELLKAFRPTPPNQRKVGVTE